MADIIISKTYKDVAEEFIAEMKKISPLGTGFNDEEKVAIKLYAGHLDSQNIMDDKLALMAMEQTRKLDREFTQMLIDALGIPKATEIAREFTNKHKHSKIKI